MKAIASSIRQFDQGNAVSNLQQALTSLGFLISNDEQIASFFGDTTSSALRRFQESFQIPATDSVDENTAKTLNEVLKHKQLLDKDFRVNGHVLDVLGRPVVQASVAAFDVDLRGILLINKVTSIRETMQMPGFQWIGSAATNNGGYYQIEFDAESFIFGDKSHADTICFLTLEDKIIARSSLAVKRDYIGNAIENLDIRLATGDLIKGISEYEALINAVAPILRMSDLSLTDIANSLEQINFLAQETDSDSSKILLAAQAESLLFGRTELSGTDYLYALGRENVGLTYGEIIDFTHDVLVEKITAAIAKNIIQTKSEESIHDFIKRLLRLAASLIFLDTSRAPKTVQNLNRSLEITLTTPALKNVFLNVHRQLEINADPKKFWQEALPQAGFNTQQIQSLKVTNQLHLITGGHTPLVEWLQVDQGISSPERLLSLTDTEWMEAINKAGLPENIEGESIEERSQNFIGHVRNVLHAAYPTQKIALMIRSGELPIPDLTNGLNAFFNRATDFDFATRRLEDFENVIQDVAPQQAEQIRSSLQTMQRVFQISPTPEAMSGMIANGISSAFQVAGVPEAAFVKTYAKQLGGEGVAIAVHSRATYVVAKANETLMTTYELTHAITPSAIHVGSMKIKNAIMDSVKKHIPNYENIFGQADICECRDCRSINSPAAYLVDVMRFLSKLSANPTGKLPLDVLSERRPDLAHLPLTCENTNTVIPYIDLVNEILEYYVANEKLDAKTAHDTGSVTTKELRAAPQYRLIEAYKKLAAAVYPFSLPYHHPLDTIRSFIPDAAKRAGLMRKLNRNGIVVEAENLELSQKEYAILTGQNFDGTPEGTDLWSFYGYADDNTLKTTIPAVKEILRRTGISYVDLVALVKTRYLNPAQAAFDYIQDLFKDFPIDISQPFNGQVLYEGLRDIHSDILDPDADFNFKSALERRNISKDDFIAWVKAHFDGLKTLVTLYNLNSDCDIENTTLRTLEQIYDAAPTALTDEFLTKFHRFVRLWRKTGWTIEALDTVLAALQTSDLMPLTVQQLSTIKAVVEKTNLPLDRLATAWGNIETIGDKSLYRRMFINRAINQIDKVFEPDHLGNLLSDTTATIGGHLNAILAAFKIQRDDFDLIAADSGVSETAILSLPHLSVLYRYVAFSKGLKLSTADFIVIKNLFTINPFSTFDEVAQQYTAVNPVATLSFLDCVEKIRDSGFKAKELNYIFTGEDNGLSTDKIAQTLISIRNELQNIEAEYPVISDGLSIDEVFLRARMVLISPEGNVDLFFGIINGTQIFNVKTQENLPITIPNELKTKVQYIKAKGILSVKGVLTPTEKVILEGLAGLTPNIGKAIITVYNLPEEQFVSAFSRYFDTPAQAAAFVERAAPLADATQFAEWKNNKYKAFYQRLLPVLKQTLRESKIVQNIAALVSLNEVQTAEILKADHNSLTNLLTDLVDEGLSATYFRTPTWTDVVTERIDKTIHFSENNAFNVAGLPLDNFSIQWEGFISIPVADEFTLIVSVAGADERFSLYLDGELVLQKPGGNTQLSWEVAHELIPNRLYQLKLEYADRARASSIKLSWRSSKTAEETIPATLLFSEKSFQHFQLQLETCIAGLQLLTSTR